MSDIYVSTSGNNSNAGTTINEPVATLVDALTKVSPGGNIWIGPGTYGTSTPILIGLTGAVNIYGQNNQGKKYDDSSRSTESVLLNHTFNIIFDIHFISQPQFQLSDSGYFLKGLYFYDPKKSSSLSKSAYFFFL
jgi:hypothetical protein